MEDVNAISLALKSLVNLTSINFYIENTRDPNWFNVLSPGLNSLTKLSVAHLSFLPPLDCSGLSDAFTNLINLT